MRIRKALSFGIVLAFAVGPGLSPITAADFHVWQTKLLANDGASNRRFGTSVAIDGDTAVVSAPALPRGAFYVLRRDGRRWSEVQKVSGDSDQKVIGQKVLLAGNRLFVSAFLRDEKQRESLHVEIYERSSRRAEWQKRHELQLCEKFPEEWFGWSHLACEGETLLAGVTVWNSDGEVASASASLFERTQGTWAASKVVSPQQKGLGISSASLSAAHAAVSFAGEKKAIVHTLERKGRGWTENLSLRSEDFGYEEGFGAGVLVQENTLVITCRGFGKTPDGLLVFEKPGSEWAYRTSLRLPAPFAKHSLQGAAILERNTLVVAGNDTDRSIGSLHLFKRHGRDWKYAFPLIPFDGKPRQYFGSALAGYDGTVLVGANGDSDQGPSAGAVYFLDRCHNPKWLKGIETVEVPIVVPAAVELSSRETLSSRPSGIKRTVFSQKPRDFDFFRFIERGLKKGAAPFMDRPDQIAVLPRMLNGLTLLQRRTQRKSGESQDHTVECSVEPGSSLFLAIDERMMAHWQATGLPAWLNEYQLTQFRLTAAPLDQSEKSIGYLVFAKAFSSGSLRLNALSRQLGHQTLWFAFVGKPFVLPAADVKFPPVTGPFPVGTASFHLVDSSRPELYTPDDRDDKRELMVQFWYPSESSGHAPAKWLDDADVFIPEARKGFRDIPAVFWDGSRRIIANAARDAPMLKSVQRFPVLIYAHGWSQMRTENTWLLEELASRGYVAVSVDFTYNSKAVRFPDGRVLRQAFLSATNTTPVDVNVQDVRFVLDTLHNLDSNPEVACRFGGRLDLDRVAIAGFSHGGIVALQTLQKDARFKAGVILDVRSDFSKVAQPFLFLGRPASDVFYESRPAGFGNGGYIGLVKGTGHFDFSDLSLAWALLKLPASFNAAIIENDPIRIHRVTADHVIAFLDKHLRLKRGALFDPVLSQHPEVEFKTVGEH